MLKPILIAATMLLTSNAPEAAPPSSPAAQPGEQKSDAKPAAAAETIEKPAIDIHADNPPPTSWDKSPENPKSPALDRTTDENTLAQQLFQTLIAPKADIMTYRRRIVES